jgi:hypothetical protein
MRGFIAKGNTLVRIYILDSEVMNLCESVVCSHGVPQNENDRISSKKHLGNISFFGYGMCLLLAFAFLGHLSPELLNIFQNHVAVSVKGLDSSQQLLVVPHINQHLRVVLYGVQ